jgi:phosphate transport system substrate-binding protein
MLRIYTPLRIEETAEAGAFQVTGRNLQKGDTLETDHLSRRHTLLVLLTIFTLLASACTGKNGNMESVDGALSGNLDIIGSNTVTPVSSAWAEEFMKINPGVSISVSGPGSGAGIAALINKTTEVCQSSRPITEAEIKKAAANDVAVVEHRLAADGIAVVVHPSNPVNDLTLQQVSDIYSGKITNWSQVGGNKAPIVLLSRDTASGTYAFFLEEIVQLSILTGSRDRELNFASNAQLLPSSSQGVKQTAGNRNGIFYSGLGYVDSSVKVLGIRKTAGDPAVLPSIATVQNGSYPVSRFLFYYTNGHPAGATRAFLDFGLSRQGQALVENLGFVPVKQAPSPEPFTPVI